ncbi:MAG: hypothetical protein LBB80_04785 [Treponema sp.]|nr:hypothetical protein [Treponema sp.]
MLNSYAAIQEDSVLIRSHKTFILMHNTFIRSHKTLILVHKTLVRSHKTLIQEQRAPPQDRGTPLTIAPFLVHINNT